MTAKQEAAMARAEAKLPDDWYYDVSKDAFSEQIVLSDGSNMLGMCTKWKNQKHLTGWYEGDDEKLALNRAAAALWHIQAIW
jgi:hypothetical protein